MKEKDKIWLLKTIDDIWESARKDMTEEFEFLNKNAERELRDKAENHYFYFSKLENVSQESLHLMEKGGRVLTGKYELEEDLKWGEVPRIYNCMSFEVKEMDDHKVIPITGKKGDKYKVTVVIVPRGEDNEE